jgi:hypothetical protein
MPKAVIQLVDRNRDIESYFFSENGNYLKWKRKYFHLGRGSAYLLGREEIFVLE